AAPDASGRCACGDGTVPVLGACVSSAVGDAYCMPPSRSTMHGDCEMPACAATEAVDLETGCLSLSALARGGARACGPDAALIVDDRHAACVPEDAACPRGTSAGRGACSAAVVCPPGALPHAGACFPLVSREARGPRMQTVDVGAWAALVLGTDHGDGADTLCRPLAARPSAFGLAAGDKLSLVLRIALTFPDEDVSAVHASVDVSASTSRPLTPAAIGLVDRAVGSLVELLRGLGGEASATRVEVKVRCPVASL
ncbi:MAG: hypothetical protein ACRELB_04455, partial [Polyangiaceae bacterium]